MDERLSNKLASPSPAPADRIETAAHIAPRWHTAALVALYLAVAAAGVVLSSTAAKTSISQEHAPRIAVYAPVLLVQLLLAFYVVRVGRNRSALGFLVGEGWTTARRACVDVALAGAIWLVIRLVELAATRWMPGAPRPIEAILPHTPFEQVAWAGVSLIVGTCEELVFRGYLRIQLAFLSGRTWVGIVGQALVFGVAHLQQGLPSAFRIAFYGLVLGTVAHYRRSIVPCVIAHVATDFVSGLVH